MGGGVKRDRGEYLREWKRKKAIEDPDYFRRAGRAAGVKRKAKLDSSPEEKSRARHRSAELRKVRHKEDPRVEMLTDSRKRAKARGMEHLISKEDIIIPEFCPVLGIRLEVGIGKREPHSPSIDRVDNSKGYIPGNVRVISSRANTLKGDGAVWEFKEVIRYMEEHNGMVCNG